MFSAEAVDSLSKLASAVGAPGAALLLLCLGIAWHLPKLAGVVRQIVKDWQDHSRKTRELEHRIASESAALRLEIERKESATCCQGAQRNERRR